MLNYPTLEHPFSIQLQNYVKPYSIPGLKNSSQLGVNKNGQAYLTKKQALKDFLDESGRKIAEAYFNEGFDTILTPKRVTGWGFIDVYSRNPENLPKLDTDNQWQTIQEILAPNVIQDDKQIEGFYPQRVYTKVKEGQHACFWFWVMQPDIFLFEQQIEFYRVHYNEIWSMLKPSLNSEKRMPIQLRNLLDQV